MPSTHSQAPKWLRQRAIGKCQRGPQASIESMRRLQLETCLEGHLGCVNCLEWNQRGNLLASGSDDRNVIIWDPFKGTKRCQIQTGHQGNVFSVKFVPDSSDTLIATCASDYEVKLINILANETVMNCKCHRDRVKRLATHPNEPHLVWSAGEEGYVMQYDIREEHSNCQSSSKPKNLLIDLKTSGLTLSAKCLAINPIRDEMLAVGSNDAYIRLFDRRYLRRESSLDSCTAYFTPGHLFRPTHKTSPQSFGTTYLAFSPDGTELLANIHAEQIYLFNTYEPSVRYKSFEGTIKPLILDQPTTTDYQKSRMKPHLQWRELKKLYKCIDLPEKYRDFYQTMNRKLKAKSPIGKEDFDKMNESLSETKNCVELYHIRASALIQRGWRGDHYQAIRDCCCAFALNPLDYPSLENLAYASCHMGDKEAAFGLLEIIKIIQQEFGAPDGGLQQAAKALSALLRDSPTDSSRSSWMEVRLDNLANEFSNNEEQHNRLDVSPPIANDGDDDEDMIVEVSLTPQSYYMTHLFIDPTTDFQDLIYGKEAQRSLDAFDYTKRFCGHCNMNTDIKEVNFFGRDGEFIVGGSDDGAFYIWDKHTTNIVKAVYGDMQILNCLQPHPSICMLATSGIEPSVKLWSPSGKTCHDVKSLELRCAQNQDFIDSDPLEAMIMMLYPTRDI